MVLYCIWYCIVHGIVLHCIVWHCMALYRIVLDYIALYCIVIVFSALFDPKRWHLGLGSADLVDQPPRPGSGRRLLGPDSPFVALEHAMAPAPLRVLPLFQHRRHRLLHLHFTAKEQGRASDVLCTVGGVLV